MGVKSNAEPAWLIRRIVRIELDSAIFPIFRKLLKAILLFYVCRRTEQAVAAG